jgi:DNA-binding transcriptional regulator YhcF (GntR family)
VEIKLDRKERRSLLEQARHQIISALHAGIVRRGDRLPSLRSVATISRLNVKTVLRIYARLRKEGLVALRKGSGAFIAEQDPGGIEPAESASLGRMLRRHLVEASTLNVAPRAYATLVQRLVTRSALKLRSVAVLECNEEQVHLYAREIGERLGARARPVLLEELREPMGVANVRAASILAVTDFHLEEGREVARRFQKPIVRLRLRRDFIPALMAAARHGRLSMIVSNTSFFPAFKRALGTIGLEAEHLERIRVAAGDDRKGVARAIARADVVYLSPLCDAGLRGLIRGKTRLLSFEFHISSESLEELEDWLLLSGAGMAPLPPTRS